MEIGRCSLQRRSSRWATEMSVRSRADSVCGRSRVAKSTADSHDEAARAELERLASHDLIARFSAALAVRPGREIESDAPIRRAAILLVMRLREDGDPELL